MMFYVISMKKMYKKILAAAILLFFTYSFISAANKVFPLRYIEQISDYSRKYGLEPALVCAVINAESRFNAEAVSPKNARGLMQLMEMTADWAAGEIGIINYDYSKIHEPKINIEIGCWYLSRLLEQYDKDLTLALAAYNAGSGNVAKWLENKSYSKDGASLDYIPFKETKNYVNKISVYKRVYSILLKVRTAVN